MTDRAALIWRKGAKQIDATRRKANALWLPFGPAPDPRRARIARPSRNRRTSIRHRLFLYPEPAFPIRYYLTRETDR